MLKNIHLGLEDPTDSPIRKVTRISGDYIYFNYGCDGVDDRGWGCGYRTLQTICSWVCTQKQLDMKKVPTLRNIQEILVEIEDKPKAFIGSREWIGSLEVCYVLDKLYDIPSKIQHIKSGNDIDNIITVLQNHFSYFGSPVMMGGNLDAISKCIIGTASAGNNHWMLVVDPHYYGHPKNKEQLQQQHWVAWVNIKDFTESSFYNFCLPQLKSSTNQK
ncbi:ufm1-specific protease 1-like [Artemia franciscana]|uniref:UFSP1/2/DUB catalytic domain-containing protein n=1 Tax=Artemia franciscana TaxID=6661 RepID=A0AA88HJZ0_ARTSF|nr:hypothetical protein QYM36_012069 [Artemia franciscana]